MMRAFGMSAAGEKQNPFKDRDNGIVGTFSPNNEDYQSYINADNMRTKEIVMSRSGTFGVQDPKSGAGGNSEFPSVNLSDESKR